MNAPMSEKRKFRIAVDEMALVTAKRRLFYAVCRQFFGFGSAAEVYVRRSMVHRLEREISTLSAGPKAKRDELQEAV